MVGPLENTETKKDRKMPETTSIFKISKNKKMHFSLMFQGPLKQKIRFLAQKMCPVARGQTNNSQTNNSQTNRHGSENRGPPIGFSRFRSFNLRLRSGPINTYCNG